jgi:hypothetical protein
MRAASAAGSIPANPPKKGEQEFNPLAAQREACEAYIRSQQYEGWLLASTRYDDGGFSLAAIWSGRRCKACSPISGPAGSTSSLSTRSTG